MRTTLKFAYAVTTVGTLFIYFYTGTNVKFLLLSVGGLPTATKPLDVTCQYSYPKA